MSICAYFIKVHVPNLFKNEYHVLEVKRDNESLLHPCGLLLGPPTHHILRSLKFLSCVTLAEMNPAHSSQDSNSKGLRCDPLFLQSSLGNSDI